jgi:radical SAM protein with 4Fe4S-binding SPASM domain
VGTALHHLDLMPTFGQYTDALRDLTELDVPEVDLHGLDPFSPETRSATQPVIHTNHGCGAGQHVCSVSVQGDVNPCSFLGPAFNSGNIREWPFEDIWRTGQALRRLRHPEEPDAFRGGCRARAQTFAGSALAADPWFEEFEGRAGAPHPGANVEIAGRRSLPLL